MARRSTDPLIDQFGGASCGVRWALSRIEGVTVAPGGIRIGDRRLCFSQPAQQQGDAYAVAWSPSEVTITAGTAIGAAAGLLGVGEQLAAGRCKPVSRPVAFQTRFYKHEVQWLGRPTKTHGTHAGGDRPITKYTDRMLDAFFQRLVARRFNAVVVYAGYHPFEQFLDYRGFDHGTDNPADIRKQNFEALSRFFARAKAYGLRTFLHHYVSHFSQALADHLKLGLSESGARLAGIDHPTVEAYNRYIYRRTFETIPALDGLFANFESSGNAVPFMQKTLMRVARATSPRPALYFRLWGVSDVDGMKHLLADYDGPKGLVHKSHDTNDIYFYPVADDRVKVWKSAMPDVEFAFSVGPCHNCGTNISRKLWTDPAYVHALLASIQRKGADSISFQSSSELLLDGLPDVGFFDKGLRDHARMNQGHLDAVVDFVNGRRPDSAQWAARYANWFGTTLTAGATIRDAIVESSQIILKHYRQFCYGSSQEGYLYPGRFSHYQEPFFYAPMAFHDQLGRIPYNVSWRSWAVRTGPVKVVPNDTQAAIDYVNPSVRRKPANNPGALIRQIKAHITRSTRAVAAYRKEAGRKADRSVIDQVMRNCLFGERSWREIQIAIELSACYFATTKAKLFGHVRRAAGLMHDTTKVLGKDLADTDSFLSTTASGPFQPEKDANELEAILAMAPQRVPFDALHAYMRSHERYNEIRRMCRPYVSVRGTMVVRNRRLLTQAMHHATRAVDLLGAPQHALYRDNVMAWVSYLRAELDWLTPPAMRCASDDGIGRDDGFRPMVHDQCYRWGEPCWRAIASFYRRADFFGPDVCDCRATYTKRGLVVSLREHGIDWAQRKAVWDANRGSINQGGFMRLFIDVGNTGDTIANYVVFFEGVGGTVSRFTEHPNGHIHSEPDQPFDGFSASFAHTDSQWRCDVEIPWRHLGARPTKGQPWRVNVLSNPSVTRNRQVAWCQGYEYRSDVARLGTLVFD